VKTFVFGRHKDDPKGPPEEHGEVTIQAPSLPDARAAFVKEHGEKDARTYIVRAVDVAACDCAPKPKRARKR